MGSSVGQIGRQTERGCVSLAGNEEVIDASIQLTFTSVNENFTVQA